MPNNRFGWTKVLAQAPGSARVLVVDDEVQVRQSLTRLVTHFGYEVKTAASAEEADHWLSSQRFHVVLLDIELPRMKGVEFLSWALEKDPEQAVIMLTGLDDPDLAIECIDKGARTYLVKPVEAEFLRLALRDALAMRRLLVERNDLSVAVWPPDGPETPLHTRELPQPGAGVPFFTPCIPPGPSFSRPCRPIPPSGLKLRSLS